MREETSYGIIPLQKERLIWRVFLVQHRAGHWSFPKGHPEDGEDSKQTAERELNEETGLVVKRYLSHETLSETYFFNHQGQKIKKTVIYFLAEVEGKVILQEREIAKGAWCAVDEAHGMLTFPEAKKIARGIQLLVD